MVPDPLLLWIATGAIACGLLVWSEARSWSPGIWIFKPLAATAFVAVALAAGALDTSYGRWLLLGLFLCWGGDLLLIPKQRETTFLAGIGSFLLGHLAYGVAFASLGLSGTALGIAFAGVAGLGALVLRWLRPHLDGVFVVAVPLYVLVIGGMLVTAIAAAAAGATPAIAIGAAAFAVSDLFVARDRLIAPSFANAGYGLPLYFGAQLLLAATAGA